MAQIVEVNNHKIRMSCSPVVVRPGTWRMISTSSPTVISFRQDVRHPTNTAVLAAEASVLQSRVYGTVCHPTRVKRHKLRTVQATYKNMFIWELVSRPRRIVTILVIAPLKYSY